MSDKKKISSDEVVSMTDEDLKKIKKKKLTKIIAIVVAAVIGLGIIGTAVFGFLTMDDENGFFYKIIKRGNLSAPKNVRVDEFNQQSDYLVLIKWDDVVNATDYTLQVKYELYPDEIHSFTVKLNGRYIERKRGNLYFRVRANNLSGEGKFSGWKQFYIEPMKLELPEITMTQEGENVHVSWTPIEYAYLNETRGVWFEVYDGGYWVDEDEPEYWESTYPFYTTRTEHTFPIAARTDVFTLRVRPLNYIILNVNPLQIIEEPPQLFDIYETPDEWAEAEIVIEK
ncbi:MAG: hypothetical protein QM214_05970 [Bacillota bacterium]|nr:hypothetical protein [Bacillota bacterium]HHU42710.1 hypothetical protein [Clostridiales bacterium]